MMSFLRDTAGFAGLLLIPVAILCLLGVRAAHRGHRLGLLAFLVAWVASVALVLVVEGGAGFTWSLSSWLVKYGLFALGTGLPTLAALIVLRSRWTLAHPRAAGTLALLVAVPAAAFAPAFMLIASCAITGDCP